MSSLSELVARVTQGAPSVGLALFGALLGVAWAQVGEPAGLRVPVETPIGSLPMALGDITLPIALVVAVTRLSQAVAAITAWRPGLDLRVEMKKPPRASPARRTSPRTPPTKSSQSEA